LGGGRYHTGLFENTIYDCGGKPARAAGPAMKREQPLSFGRGDDYFRAMP
jgi:hypothetical protein